MAQGKDTFVCDLVSFIILCTDELYSSYVDPLKNMTTHNSGLSMTWENMFMMPCTRFSG
jgi:hypothetical protein